MKKLLAKLLPSVVVLLIGGGVAAALVATRPATPTNTQPALPRLVRTIRVTPTEHRPAVHAYGTSQADQQWTAITEVAGRIEMLSDAFDDGEVLAEGTLITTIDQREYESALQTAETEVQTQLEKLEEISRSTENTRSLIPLREEQVAIAKSETERLRDLSRKNAGSIQAYERAASSHLESITALQNLRNELALLPIRKRSVETALKAARLRVETARRDLERCEIRMPFTGLCVHRSAEKHEHVTPGRTLGRFISVRRAQVVAMIEARRLLRLLPRLGDTIGVIDLRNQSTSLMKELRKQFRTMGVPADVTWRAGEGFAQWRGTLARVSATVDESTRSIPLIIEVDDAFSAIKLGRKARAGPRDVSRRRPLRRTSPRCLCRSQRHDP